MRYTALALDYDGTIAHDGVVPAHVLEGLARLKASGRKLLLVTGRELEELLGIFPEIGIFDRVVAENGALLYRPSTRERVALGDRPPARLVERLQAAGIPLAVGHTIVATVRPHEGVVLEAIASLGLEQQVIFNKGAVMILPPGCNKASGLSRALAELGLSARNAVAAGDGENDHAMLDMSEYSVATANAIETLKQVADYVTRATHGDGVLEVVRGMVESDLAALPPARPRRTLCLGRDEQGVEVRVPRRRASVLVSGERVRARAFAAGLASRLRRGGYQCCIVDSRGDYPGMEDAIAFGTADNPPSVEEIVGALARPDVQVIACLAAIPEAGRAAFVRSLLAPLARLREATGRPHWIVMDDANALLGGAAADPFEAVENVIYVASDPRALPGALLAGVEGISVAEGESPLWSRDGQPPVRLADLGAHEEAGDGDAKGALPEGARVEKSAQVGQVLRRA